MRWSDHRLPLDEFHMMVCFFCVKDHTEKELINWQMQQINNIETEKLRYVIKNLYRYFTFQITLLEERINEYHESRKEKEEKA